MLAWGVTQEITGSNPVESACDDYGAVRKPAKRPRPPLRGGARTLVTAGSTPACAIRVPRDDWALASPTGRNPVIP